MSNYKIPTSDSFNSPMPRLRPSGLASRNNIKPEEPEQGPLERFFSLFRSSGGENKPPENKSSASRAMKFYDTSNNKPTTPSKKSISSRPMRIGKAREELDLFEELDVVAPGVITVASGDTLSAIARDNNTTVAEIQKANPTITNPDRINVGQDISIPSVAKQQAKPAGIMTKPKLRSLTKKEREALTNVSKGVVPANVDFDFIKKREGYKLNMYIPTDKKGKPLGNSGSTIASGFDLGQRNEADLKGLPTSLVNKLKPYLGLKGSSADTYIKANPLVITDAEGVRINKFAKQQEIDRLKKDWENSSSSVAFDDLTKGQATVVASVAFQYGDLPTRSPIFWKHVTNGDWSKAEQELRSFGDKYSSRRKLEANYLVNN
jgi:LysM repeat protein/GH24 family phage-related lysozyme (muramidase)